MREQLLNLIEVQKIDAKIAEIKRSSEQYPKRLASQENKVKAAREQVNLIKNELDALQKEYEEKEGTLKIEEAKLKKWEARLSDIRNQREYISLSREVEAAKRQNKEDSEQMLELLNTIEEKKKIRDTLSDDLAVLEVDFAQEATELKAKIAQIEEEIAGEVKVRDELTKAVKPNILKKYEIIRDRKKGIALVAAKDGCCKGCNMNIPPQLYNTLLRMNSIELCPCCNRIIYWEGITEEKKD